MKLGVSRNSIGVPLIQKVIPPTNKQLKFAFQTDKKSIKNNNKLKFLYTFTNSKLCEIK